MDNLQSRPSDTRTSRTRARAGTTNTATTNPDQLSGEDLNFLKVLKVVKEVSRDMLLWVLDQGNPQKDHNTDWEQYLLHHRGWTPGRFNKEFDAHQRELINTNPRGDQFDITLLNKLITHSCDRLGSKDRLCEILMGGVPADDRNQGLKNHLKQKKGWSANKVKNEFVENCPDFISKNFDEKDLWEVIVSKAEMISDRDLLHEILMLGHPNKDPNQTMENYLVNQQNWKQAKFVKTIDQHMKKELQSYDCKKLSEEHLRKLIKETCNKYHDDVWKKNNGAIKQKLEYLITQVKDERNQLLRELNSFTDAQMKDKIKMLHDLLKQVVDRTCDKYSLHDVTRNDKLAEVDTRLANIKDQTLPWDEVVKLIKKKEEEMKTILREMAREELQQTLKQHTHITPLSFLALDNFQVDIELAFSKIIMKQQHGEDLPVEYQNILKMAQQSAGRSSGKSAARDKKHKILVEGPAGSGKTTLVKMFLHHWCHQQSNIHNLDSHDLLIYHQCRDRHTASLDDLIRTHMPQTFLYAQSAGMSESFINSIILNCYKVLFLIDGVDELNDKSRIVYEQILHKCAWNDKHTILSTCKPEKIQWYFHLVSDQGPTYHVVILGIPPDQRAAFLTKQHDLLKAENVSKHNTDDLIAAVGKSLPVLGFYKHALNVLLVAYLWAYKPQTVDQVSTATNLYKQTDDMRTERLIEKLIQQGNSQEPQELRDKIQEFLKQLQVQALVSTSQEEIILQPASMHKLKECCHNIGLGDSFKDVCSNFLIYEATRTPTGVQEQPTFGHKDYQDFCSGKGIFLALTDRKYYELLPLDNKNMSSGEILELFMDLYDKNSKSFDITKYQNILKHLAGILADAGSEAKEECSKKLVELFSKTGVRGPRQWLELLSEFHCHEHIARYIATHIIRDKHRTVIITDESTGGWASLMSHLQPQQVKLIIKRDSKLNPRLKELSVKISKKNWTVQLHLYHHYYHHEGPSDDILRPLINQDAKCTLVVFWGRVDDPQLVQALPSSITRLHLAIVDPAVLPALHAASLPSLKCLKVHVPVKQVTGDINRWSCRLPRVEISIFGGVELNLSGVDDENCDVACCVAAMLCPPDSGYLSINFPGSTLRGKAAWERVIRELRNRNITLQGGLWVPVSCVTSEEKDQLAQLTRTVLGGRGFVSWDFSEWQQ